MAQPNRPHPQPLPKINRENATQTLLATSRHTDRHDERGLALNTLGVLKRVGRGFIPGNLVLTHLQMYRVDSSKDQIGRPISMVGRFTASTRFCDDLNIETEVKMEWVTPQFSRSKLDLAGQYLISHDLDYDDFEDVLAVISNWRSAHSRPLYTFRFGLRRYAKAIDPSVLVAQRIKRLSSIALKLR